jgi:flagella basal body P-ring formation protein FlgA
MSTFTIRSAIMRHALLAALVLASHPWAHAAEAAPIQRAIEDFLQRQNQSLPGRASHVVGAINATGLPDCDNLNITMGDGAKPWGRTNVIVSCAKEGATWRLYVPVQIHVAVNYLVSARPIRSGQILAEADIASRPGDLFNLPTGVITDPLQAIGQVSSVSLPADRPLRTNMLRPPQVVKQGQNVKIFSGGAGFQVSSEGQALNSAAAGQVVRVRLPSGQVTSGIARTNGIVEITY